MIFAKKFILLYFFVGLSSVFADNSSTPALKELKEIIEEDYSVFEEGGNSFIGDIYVRAKGSEIAKEYSKNELRADKKFKGKAVLIIGKVAAIRSAFGKPFVKISSNMNYGVNNPRLIFYEDEMDFLEKLDKGDIGWFVCTGTGETGGVASFKNCNSSKTEKKAIVEASLSAFKKSVESPSKYLYGKNIQGTKNIKNGYIGYYFATLYLASVEAGEISQECKELCLKKALAGKAVKQYAKKHNIKL